MQTRRTPFGFMVVLERGDELIRSLIAFARQEEVEAAELAGIGAVDHAELGFYDLDRQDYERRVFDEALEACSLTGTLSLLDGEPFPHVHGVFSRPDSSTLGGHVFEAVCSVTLELAVHTAPEAITRASVDFCNLKLMKLEERA